MLEPPSANAGPALKQRWVSMWNFYFGLETPRTEHFEGLKHKMLDYVEITSTSRVFKNTILRTPLYLLINTTKRTVSFKYTVRAIAIYIIAFVNRSLFVFAYNDAPTQWDDLF